VTIFSAINEDFIGDTHVPYDMLLEEYDVKLSQFGLENSNLNKMMQEFVDYLLLRR
jgi:hypothetical protein